MTPLKQALLKREAEKHLSESIVEWRPLKNTGSLNVSFFGVTKSGIAFTAKYNVICKETLQQRKIRKEIDEKTDLIFPKLICSYVSFSLPLHTCFLTEWIEGDCLDLQSLNDDPKSLYDCAVLVSKKLKTVHAIETTYRFAPRSLKRDYKRALRKIRFFRINVPHLSEFVKFVDGNLNKIKNTPQGYVHFDFHPGNIIKQGGDYRIIDLETICVSELWRDLVYAAEINFPEQHKFWLLFLLGYFDGKIPNEFFLQSKIYVIIYMLMLAKYNRNGDMEMYFNLVNKVYEDYNSLRTDISDWMIKTATELSTGTEFFVEGLNDILKSTDNSLY